MGTIVFLVCEEWIIIDQDYLNIYAYLKSIFQI